MIIKYLINSIFCQQIKKSPSARLMNPLIGLSGLGGNSGSIL